MRKLYLYAVALVAFIGVSFGFVLPWLISAPSDLAVGAALFYGAFVVPYVTATLVAKIVIIVKGLLK